MAGWATAGRASIDGQISLQIRKSPTPNSLLLVYIIDDPYFPDTIAFRLSGFHSPYLVTNETCWAL